MVRLSFPYFERCLFYQLSAHVWSNTYAKNTCIKILLVIKHSNRKENLYRLLHAFWNRRDGAKCFRDLALIPFYKVPPLFSHAVVIEFSRISYRFDLSIPTNFLLKFYTSTNTFDVLFTNRRQRLAHGWFFTLTFETIDSEKSRADRYVNIFSFVFWEYDQTTKC